MKKEILILFVIFFSSFVSASLGITPAKHEIDFLPGEGREFIFMALSDDPNKEIEIYLEGDLAQYGKVSKTKVYGSESFKVTLFLPESIEKPGEHSLIVRAKEAALEGEFLGSQIIVGALIKVFVPYPGKYAEISLKVPNGNWNDLIPIEVSVFNKGRENLIINSFYIEFLTDNKDKIYTMPLNLTSIDVLGEKNFKRQLNTSDFKPGNYEAAALLDYGGEKIAKVNQTFRVGSLFVNITNFTTIIEKKGIQKFHADIESMWNSNLENVFADVVISNISGEVFYFRTPPVNLEPWSRAILESYIDTEKLEEGIYDLGINLSYMKSYSYAYGKLKIKKSDNILKIVIATASLLLIIFTAFIIIKFARKKFRNSKK